MPTEEKFRAPWLLAVWPGMGGVALSGDDGRMAKPGMHLRVESPVGESFDLEQVEVKEP